MLMLPLVMCATLVMTGHAENLRKAANPPSVAESSTSVSLLTSCPVGFTSGLNNKCYINVGFELAGNCRSECSSRGATLPCIESSAEDEFFGDFLGDLGRAFLNYNRDIGWGTGCPSTYVADIMESTVLPDNVGVPYTIVEFTTLPWWIYVNNDDFWYSSCVCEFRSTVPTATPSKTPSKSPTFPPTKVPTAAPTLVATPPPSAAPSSACPVNWAQNGNKCYMMIPGYMGHSSCESYCPLYDSRATLPCVENSGENAFLHDAYSYEEPIRVGYNDIASEGSFVWQAGCSSTYTNWMATYPNGGSASNSVLMMSNGQWADTYVSNNLRCVCEIKL